MSTLFKSDSALPADAVLVQVSPSNEQGQYSLGPSVGGILNALRTGPIEHRIAEHVVSLIPDGATLQFGIGAVPEAIMGLLSSRSDLGIHSGLFSDGLIDPLEGRGRSRGRARAPTSA